MGHDKNETRLDLHYLNVLIAVPFVITTGMHTRTDMIEAIYSLKIPVTKLHYHRTFCFLLQAEQTTITIKSTLRETNAFLSLGFSHHQHSQNHQGFDSQNNTRVAEPVSFPAELLFIIIIILLLLQFGIPCGRIPVSERISADSKSTNTNQASTSITDRL